MRHGLCSPLKNVFLKKEPVSDKIKLVHISFALTDETFQTFGYNIPAFQKRDIGETEQTDNNGDIG